MSNGSRRPRRAQGEEPRRGVGDGGSLGLEAPRALQLGFRPSAAVRSWVARRTSGARSGWPYPGGALWGSSATVISPPRDVTYLGSTGQPSKLGTVLTISSVLLLQIFAISFLI